jgi:hypothetical protein
VTIDGKEYSLDALSDEVKAKITNVRPWTRRLRGCATNWFYVRPPARNSRGASSMTCRPDESLGHTFKGSCMIGKEIVSHPGRMRPGTSLQSADADWFRLVCGDPAGC